jgi:hypothetical protein
MTSPRSPPSFQIPRPSRSLQAAIPASDPLKPKPHDSQVLLPRPHPRFSEPLPPQTLRPGRPRTGIVSTPLPRTLPSPRACVVHSIWSVGRGASTRRTWGPAMRKPGRGCRGGVVGALCLNQGRGRRPGKVMGCLISPHWSFVATLPEQKE